MKVRLLVSRAGPGLTQTVGEEVEVTTKEAERMIAAGQAELVRSKTPQRAVRKPKVEKAAK